MAISALPPAPARTDPPPTFVTKADTFVAALSPFGTEANALAVDVNAKQVLATNAASAAASSANEAAASVTSAASAANVVKWVSGTTYNEGVTVWSPINFLTYRRKTTGGGVTDPSVDTTNWAYVNPTNVGMGGALLTSDVTLTALSAAAMSVTPTVAGYYAMLPSATTLSKAVSLYSAYITGEFDYGFKNNSGTKLGWLRPRTASVIGLADSSTSAGVWVANLEKTGVTAEYLNSTVANCTGGLRRLRVDADRDYFIFHGTDAYGIVYNKTTKVWGSPQLIRATIDTDAVSCILSATDQILIVTASNTALEAVTVTLSGTGQTLNSGTKATATLAFGWGLGGSSGSQLGYMATVGSTFVYAYVTGSQNACVRAITVSGTTPTLGSEAQVATAGGRTPLMFISGSILRTVVYDGTNIVSKPYTVSGVTLTPGTQAATGATSNVIRAFLAGNGNIIIQYRNTNKYAMASRLSGTTETLGDVQTYDATSTLVSSEVVPISSTKTLFFGAGTGGTYGWYATIVTNAAASASITAGSDLTGYHNGGSTPLVAFLGTSGNNVTMIVATDTQLQTITLDCSGTTPTLVSTRTLVKTTATAGIGSSDPYNVRNGRQLIAGESCVFLGVGALDEARFYKKIPVLGRATPRAFSQGTVFIAGDTSSECYAGGYLNGSGFGFAISKVECAE